MSPFLRSFCMLFVYNIQHVGLISFLNMYFFIHRAVHPVVKKKKKFLYDCTVCYIYVVLYVTCICVPMVCTYIIYYAAFFISSSIGEDLH